ncbi:hypothetical protein B0J11DRAFT_520376 [Dendryphion nanum]|uniref:Uncharacterized protein n=1 Tax=Dendryphion nanum TaxID=256645 RepID=A0A9P9E3Z5_9PLEO|nr:hypothetical protein B0J11DRAFT_520376 [Dendryphion nanum]
MATRLLAAPRLRMVTDRSGAPIDVWRRLYATDGVPPPTTTNPGVQGAQKGKTRTGAFYKSFGSPIVKTFLGALFTYQVAYWGWMKLESLEEKKDIEDEIQDLKTQLKAEVVKKMEQGKETVEQVKDAVEEKKDEVVEEGKEKKKGWFW